MTDLIRPATHGSSEKYRRDNAYHRVDLKNDPVYPFLDILVQGSKRYAIDN